MLGFEVSERSVSRWMRRAPTTAIETLIHQTFFRRTCDTSQNRLRLGHQGYFLECLSSQSVGNLGQASPFSIGKQQAALDLCFQNVVLRCQILIPQQEFLIDCSRDVGQHACQTISGFLLQNQNNPILSLSWENREAH